MAENNSREKREFVRGLISTKVKITPVDLSKRDMVTAHQALSQLGASSAFGLGSTGEAVPEWVNGLIQHLARFEDKLDKILAKLGCEEPQPHSPTVADTKDISGSGISLVLTAPFEKGQMLEVSMSLPGFPMGLFQAFGEVVRVSARKGKEKGLFDVAVKFLYISEADREQIIACTFAAQRKTIRNANEID